MSHAIYAPSSAKRWINCTASAEAIANLPEQEEGEAAAEGTAAHTELERVLNGGAPDPDHPAAYIVALTIDFVRQLPPGKLYVEQRVELTKDIWGRCDVCHWDPVNEVATIVDAKNGVIDVSPDTEQLKVYGIAAVLTYNLPAKHIRLVVVQPNSFLPGPKVKQVAFGIDEMYEFAQRAAAIPKGPKTFTAGEHCRWCPLFGRCEPTIDLLVQLSVALQHTPEEVTPAQRATFKMLEKPISDWFKSADKLWTKDAIANGAPDGMKLVATQKHRAWKDEAAARRLILDKCGPDALDVPTPAQAEKLGLDVEALTERPDGGPALAFASDKRKSWERKSAAEMFAGIGEVAK